MSQYSYTKKPNWSADANVFKPRHARLANTFANAAGWVQPAAQRAYTITAVTWLSNVVTVTSAGHPIVLGQTVVISGVNPAGYNGVFTVTGVATNTFTYTLNSNPGAAMGVTTITGMTFLNGAVTVTANAHGYQAGNIVTIASVTPAGYNGTYVVQSVADANTFTYLLGTITTPGAVTIQGTAVCVPHVYKNIEVVVGLGNLLANYLDAIVLPTFTAAATYSGTAAMVTGDTLTITLTASEAVQISGTPWITVQIGNVVRQAYYATGSGTTTLTFTYNVVAADSATNWTAAHPYTIGTHFLHSAQWYIVATAYTSLSVFGHSEVTGATFTGGTGYTPGVQTVTFTGGTGTAATATSTVSAGGVPGPIVMVTAGDYSVAPTGFTISTGTTISAQAVQSVIPDTAYTTTTTNGVLLGAATSGNVNDFISDILVSPNTVVATVSYTPLVTTATTVN